MVLELISECGDKDRDVIVKTDQEPAIKFLVDDVCMARTGVRTIHELAPKNLKGSNGIVERAVLSVEQFVRTLKSALDERMAVKIDTLHPVLTWLCGYAGLLLNRFEVPCSWLGPESAEDQRQVGLRLAPWSEVERRFDRGGPGDQEHQVHPYSVACSPQKSGGLQTICSGL